MFLIGNGNCQAKLLSWLPFGEKQVGCDLRYRGKIFAITLNNTTFKNSPTVMMFEKTRLYHLKSL